MTDEIKSLSNTQIDTFFKTDTKYGGCFDKDFIINKPDRKFYIINMDKANQSGTHWTLVSMLNPSVGVYVDSEGEIPPMIVQQYMKRRRKHNFFNTKQFQSLNSDTCGYFCCYVGDQLSKGIDVKSIIDKFTTIVENEKFIRDWSINVGLNRELM